MPKSVVDAPSSNQWLANEPENVVAADEEQAAEDESEPVSGTAEEAAPEPDAEPEPETPPGPEPEAAAEPEPEPEAAAEPPPAAAPAEPSRQALVDHALAQGATQAETDEMTRTELIAAYGTPPEGTPSG